MARTAASCRGGQGYGRKKLKTKTNGHGSGREEMSLLEAVIAAVRRSMAGCKMDRDDVAGALTSAPLPVEGKAEMEIGWPTDVRHVVHVTFDRFHGFLGLPVELAPELPCSPPSASASVFGVSPESMQCGFDGRGNSVPTILLLMQERLYSQGGLKAEGIFRINPADGQEARLRWQLNDGAVPEDIDVHCLASLIKAWFRELPEGVLDGLSLEEVLRCNGEEEFVELALQLRPTQAALLDWVVELMADVVEEEDENKMNARNIAMVFAPNLTQMSDPLTALMHAVQVMNLLKALIMKSLREREAAPAATGDDLDDDDDYECSSLSPSSSVDRCRSEQSAGDDGAVTGMEIVLYRGQR